MTKNTQTQNVYEIGLHFRKLKSKEEKRKYTVPQGVKRIIKFQNNKQKGGREGRKMQREGKKENQEQVIEIEPRQKTTHAFND